MGTPHYLERPEATLAETKASVALPYGLTAEHCVAAINDVYAYLHAVNSAAALHGYPRLEDIIQAASFSGLLSELVCRAFVHATAAATPGLVRNRYPNGRPDLVPRGSYPGDSVLHGRDGVEVKVTREETSIQGHNVESGWIMVVWIEVDVTTIPIYDRAPTVVRRIAIAELEETDWTFSGRGATSRRTPTASINRGGRAKLSPNAVYQRVGVPDLRQTLPRGSAAKGGAIAADAPMLPGTEVVPVEVEPATPPD